MTLDEHIIEVWKTKYDGMDPAVMASNPAHLGLEWLKVGFHAGNEFGQKAAHEAHALSQKAREEQIRNAGFAHGMAYAAYAASTTVLSFPEETNPYRSIALAQDAIVGVLEAAARLAKDRV